MQTKNKIDDDEGELVEISPPTPLCPRCDVYMIKRRRYLIYDCPECYSVWKIQKSKEEK